ncbi:CoB--CoM heterodisulfide reductase iron-sulfur subunit B family protein [Candidatus Bathyarchaeota archaeon]|nr:CoB--CoM heterodisulfide reductase iron-sulfur subunit B family protein [Candidatus Bathyarchaeota archaeon]
MKLPVFWGCRILTSQYAYEMSIRQVLPRLGVELVDLREMHCCGDYIKSVNMFAATYMAARILALANETGIKNLLVPCSRCHFTLSETQHLLEENKNLKKKVVALLKKEKLNYSSDIKIWHIIDFIHDVIGVEFIKQKVKKSLKGLKFASHVGCQTIRPSSIKRVDNPETPRKLDELIKALGAESLEYPEKLDCCGAALMSSHQEAALTLAGSKLKALQELGVDGLIDSCPACHTMFDIKQKNAATIIGGKLAMPVLYYTQLLGIAMQINVEKLGLHLNQSPVEKILEISSS